MSFVLRPYRQFPVMCPVTYERWFHEGEGLVWNLSPMGGRRSGNLPVEPGDVCSPRLTLPTNKQISVAAGIVRWVRDEEFGLEALGMDGRAQAHLDKDMRERMLEES